MKCPKCGDEYREGFEICADCNVPLVPDDAPEEVREDAMDESFFDPGEAWENVLEHLEFHGFEIDRGSEGARVCHEKGGAFSLSPLLDGVLFEWSYPETAEAAENRREYLEWINAANGELPALRFFSDAAEKRLVQDAWCPPGYRRRDFEQFLRTVFSERQTFLLREGLSRFVELGE